MLGQEVRHLSDLRSHAPPTGIKPLAPSLAALTLHKHYSHKSHRLSESQLFHQQNRSMIQSSRSEVCLSSPLLTVGSQDYPRWQLIVSWGWTLARGPNNRAPKARDNRPFCGLICPCQPKSS